MGNNGMEEPKRICLWRHFRWEVKYQVVSVSDKEIWVCAVKSHDPNVVIRFDFPAQPAAPMGYVAEDHAVLTTTLGHPVHGEAKRSLAHPSIWNNKEEILMEPLVSELQFYFWIDHPLFGEAAPAMRKWCHF